MSGAGHAVVTGCAGFIGSTLVAELLAAGHTVTGIDKSEPLQAPRLATFREHPDLRLLCCDLGRIEGNLNGEIVGVLSEADVVYHLSGNTENRSANAEWHADLDVTVGGTVGLLDAVVRGGTAPIVVLASSQLVYDPSGSADGDVPPLRPRSQFGAGKLAAEGFVSAYAHEFGFRARSCRLSNIIGPSFRRGIVHDFTRSLFESPWLQVLGDGSQRRSFLTAEDCARALMSATHDTPPETSNVVEVFDVSNFDTISALEVATIVGNECPYIEPEILVEGKPAAWRGDVGSVHAPPHALTARGWTPRHDSAETVRETVRILFDELDQEEQ